MDLKIIWIFFYEIFFFDAVLWSFRLVMVMD